MLPINPEDNVVAVYDIILKLFLLHETDNFIHMQNHILLILEKPLSKYIKLMFLKLSMFLRLTQPLFTK